MNEADRRRDELISREAGRSGLRGRINAKCIECIVDPYSNGGTWKQQIEACTDKACPLYAVRPLPSYETESQRAKRLAKGEE